MRKSPNRKALDEAIQKLDLPLAVGLLRRVKLAYIQSFIESVVHSVRSENQPIDRDSYGWRLLNNLTQSKKAAQFAGGFFDAIEKLLLDGPEQSMAILRLALLKTRLKNIFDLEHRGWEMQDLLDVAGPEGLGSDSKIGLQLRQAADQPLKPFGLEVELMNEALVNHCPPILDLCEPLLKKVATGMDEVEFWIAPQISRMSCTGHYSAVISFLSLRRAQHEVNPVHFKATLDILKANGHDATSIDLSCGGPGGLLKDLALNAQSDVAANALAMLPHLMAMGLNPHQRLKGNKGRAARDFVRQPEVRDRWDAIVKSYEARQMMTNLIKDLDIQGMKP